MGKDTGQGQWPESGDWTGATAVGRRNGQGREKVAKSGAVTRVGHEA